MLRRGDILGDTYEIMEKIGHGGFGEVYLAWHRRLQKKVVIKKIQDRAVGKINERGEADILKKLHHNYLPQVYDFCQDERGVYTVIEYIEGKSLADYLKGGQLFSERQIITWLRELCEALEYLHNQKPPIIHSDIKPANIMVTLKGDICLIDFNVSLGDESSKGSSGFSERYASPEQLQKGLLYRQGGRYQDVVIDARSDIYSLGVTMYHVMTGILPNKDFRKNVPIEQTKNPYSAELNRIIQRAMEPERSKRYAGIAQMHSDILNMKKRDRDLRKASFRQKIIMAAGLILIVGGAATAYTGYGQIQTEHFEEDYEELLRISETDDYDAIIDRGIEILNEPKYRAAEEKEPEKKADILYMIANCYFEQDDYINSLDFYEEAVDLNKKNPEYFRDYSIALARNGEIDEAENTLGTAVSLGLKEDHMYLVQAEISLGKNDYESAIEAFRKSIDTSREEYLTARAYLLCARAYRQMGDPEQEIAILEEAQSRVTQQQSEIIRALGAAYMRMYGQLMNTQEPTQYLQKAAACYERLVSGDHPSFNDQLNLAVIYNILGEYQKAEERLLMMEGLYPEDYRVYMRLALLYCEVEGQKSESDRNYTEAERRYEQAETYYAEARNSGASDADMQNLEDIMEQLYSKGWLERK